MMRSPYLAALVLTLAGCFRTDPASVRDFVKERIQEQFPGAEVKEEGADKLLVRFQDGANQTVNISAVQEGCKMVPRQCASQVSRLLIVMQEGQGAKIADYNPKDIRPLLRPRDLSKTTTVAENGAGEAIHEPLAEGMEVSYGVPAGDAIVVIDAALARKMGVDPANLRALATENLGRDPLPSFSSFPGQTGVFQVSGKGSLAILFSSRHREAAQLRLAAKEIAIALPKPGLMLISDAADLRAVNSLRQTAARFSQSPATRFSDQIYLLSSRSLALIRP